MKPLLLALSLLATAVLSQPKYEFSLVGCYEDNPSNRTLSFNSIVGSTNVHGIGSTSVMSYTLCASSCQKSKFRYAGVQNGNECRCGNSPNLGTVSTSCTIPCPGDNTEMCGGPSANFILDVSKVACAIPIAGTMAEGGLCCPERPSFQLVDQDVIDFLNTLFPEINFKNNPTPSSLTAQQLQERTAYLSYTSSPNVFFATRGSLNFTFVADGAGYRNQFGYFLIDSAGNIIPGSYKDVFGEATWDRRKKPTSYKSCIPELGLTATIGPFEVGTGVGFFIHANGVNAMTDTCKSNEQLKQCLTTFGPRNYTCYRINGCSIDPGKDPVNGMHTYHSIDEVNGDKKRHVALIKTRVGFVLGFEDLWDIGDQDYNDAMFIMQSDAILTGDFPRQCEPDCYTHNGKCDYSTGACQCVSPSNVTYTSPQCACNTCSNCSSGGICECHTRTCKCLPGFVHSSPTANDCACSTDQGTCSGVRGTFNCGKCDCEPNYESPGSSPIQGTYRFDFGVANMNAATGYVVDSGNPIGSSTSFGSFGWSSSHTDKVFLYGDSLDPERSNVWFRNQAEWSVFLTPNTIYDVTVNFGSNAESIHNLQLIGQSTITLADNLRLGVNQYVDVTRRITSTSSGRIALREPNKGGDATRVTSITIAIPPCSCVKCPGGCGTGVCNCMTGKCSCPTGFTGPNCNECDANRFGPNCTQCDCVRGTCNSGIAKDGKCTCQDGWTGPRCDTCQANYFGANCTLCPSCIPGQGSCSSGLNGTGKCLCIEGFSGTLCNQCVEGRGGATCAPCPDCGPGVCSQGITGTGKCNCPSNWVDATSKQSTNVNACNECATNFFGVNCTACPDCVNGACNAGKSGNGTCQCIAGWALQGGVCTTCATGFYGNNCAPCPTTCSVCSGTSSSNVVCTVCQPGFLLDAGKCVQTCPNGKVQVGGSCQNCSDSCLTCFGTSSNQCLTCKPTSVAPFLKNGQCVGDCSTGFFASQGTCNPCQPTCNTCSGSSTNCTSCVGSTSLLGTNCVSGCPPGMFSSQNVCLPCSTNCLTCISSSSTCTTCRPEDALNGNTCVNQCPTGTFENNQNTCVPCTQPCSTCNVSSTNCQSCIDGYLFDPLNNICTTNCTEGKYSSGGSCLQCETSCLSCFGGSSNNCISCPPGKYLQEGKCLNNCTDGFYIGTQNTCYPCSPTCATCNGDSANNCLTCTGILSLNDAKCVEKCPDGKFKSGNNCLNCDPSCSTCNGGSPNNCLTCQDPNYVLHQSTCLPGCPNGFFSKDGTCQNCNSNCASCVNSPSNCLNCTTGLVLNVNDCINGCPESKYNSNGVCLPCNPSCSSCSGPNNDQCTSCPPGKSLQNGVCVGKCDDGLYSNTNAVCTPCSPSCATCSGPMDCDSCEGKLFLNGKACNPTCPAGTFANQVTNTCDPCNPTCLTCSSSTSNDCLSCEEASVLNGKTCTNTCPPGKYEDPVTNVCKECFFTCNTCNNGTENDCSSCTDNLNLHLAKCIPTCPAGTYAKDNQCLPCDPKCSTCSQGPSQNNPNCDTCADGFFLLGECYDRCPTGYFDSPEGPVCELCKPCKNCANGFCECSTGECNCTGTNFSGPLCDCSTLPCPGNPTCSGRATCQCGQCKCDPKLYFGSACECNQCPGVNPCSGNGVCNCNGTCTCSDGFVGKACDIPCQYDECGVCFGNGRTCAGCDGVPNSGKVFDECGLCGGNNSTCAGCDGVPKSKKIYDRCGVCGGDGTTCVDQIFCAKRPNCESCNQGVGKEDIRKCVWCNATQGCIPIGDRGQCNTFVSECRDRPTPPTDDGSFTNNEKNNNNGALIGGLVAGGIAVAAVAGLVMLAKMKKGPLYFQVPDLDANPAAFNNPLYQEYSPAQENPLYQPPKA